MSPLNIRFSPGPTHLFMGVALTLTLSACGAPREPDLSHRAQVAFAEHQEQQASAEAQRAAAAADPSAVKRKQLPVRTLESAELARIMDGVSGDGPRLFADLRTQSGTIRCELDPTHAPQTVANFVGLATGSTPWSASARGTKTSKPFYDGLIFHRTVANFIIQTGNPGGRGGPGWALDREDGGSAHFTKPGALAMIEAADDHIHASQFFIATKADTSLAGKYAAFGRCQNLDIVAGISKAPTEIDRTGKTTSRPKQPNKLWSVKLSRGQ